MSMLHKSREDVNSEKRRMKTSIGVLAISGVMVLILAAVFAMNKRPSRRTPILKQQAGSFNPSLSEAESEINEEEMLRDRTKVSDDLNFWNMYDRPQDKTTPVPFDNRTLPDDRIELPNMSPDSSTDAEDDFLPDGSEDPLMQEDDAPANSVSDGIADIDPRTQEGARFIISGNKVFDVNELTEGTARFADIIPGIKSNTYDNEGFSEDSNGYKIYSTHGVKTSYTGIDVSKYQKKIDWARVAASGIDFAMLRMGARGYQRGNVLIDDEFYANARGCSENGIRIGLYFYSQAINPLEAMEEANYCVVAAHGRRVDYPIVFISEVVAGDSSRTEMLSKAERSLIAKTFCDTVRTYGYIPMIGASKKQFADGFELSSINKYDWWLFDTDPVSVFPYKFMMWQYSKLGKVNGIDGFVNLNLSFVDYSLR
ncbi:MAG: glycoside hydrolase family 25 protein [Lachnospiraceae bacterium]|nr:glycoside hydrolase family 25 protein [Lachnospiraceae bacterium]